MEEKEPNEKTKKIIIDTLSGPNLSGLRFKEIEKLTKLSKKTITDCLSFMEKKEFVKLCSDGKYRILNNAIFWRNKTLLEDNIPYISRSADEDICGWHTVPINDDGYGTYGEAICCASSSEHVTLPNEKDMTRFTNIVKDDVIPALASTFLKGSADEIAIVAHLKKKHKRTF